MKLILLGSGNAATQFGCAFRRAGFHFVRLFSRTEAHASALARMLDCPYTTDPREIDPSAADAVISALSDSAAPEVWRRIRFGETPVFHTAGSLPMSALEPFAAHRGVLYPLQTLTRSRILDFKSVPLYLEAESKETMALLHTLADAVSDHVREADSEQRKALHLAAVFSNNFANHMFVLAERIMKENGLDFQDLLPIIDETVRKLRDMPPEQAQTGPAVRNDGNIIADHVARLAHHPEMQALYEAVSRSIHRTAAEKDQAAK